MAFRVMISTEVEILNYILTLYLSCLLSVWLGLDTTKPSLG